MILTHSKEGREGGIGRSVELQKVRVLSQQSICSRNYGTNQRMIMERGQITLLLAEVACSMNKIKNEGNQANTLSHPVVKTERKRSNEARTAEHDSEDGYDQTGEAQPAVASGRGMEDDKITLFPRRKAGQAQPGGGHGPVILSLELLEQFYNMPLHLAAKRLGICQTAIKKVCRKLGIKKWPYKEKRNFNEKACNDVKPALSVKKEPPVHCTSSSLVIANLDQQGNSAFLGKDHDDDIFGAIHLESPGKLPTYLLIIRPSIHPLKSRIGADGLLKLEPEPLAQRLHMQLSEIFTDPTNASPGLTDLFDESYSAQQPVPVPVVARETVSNICDRAYIWKTKRLDSGAQKTSKNSAICTRERQGSQNSIFQLKTKWEKERSAAINTKHQDAPIKDLKTEPRNTGGGGVDGRTVKGVGQKEKHGKTVVLHKKQEGGREGGADAVVVMVVGTQKDEKSVEASRQRLKRLKEKKAGTDTDTDAERNRVNISTAVLSDTDREVQHGRKG
eukprot:767554-Hanusia_phi.AAC.3